MKNNGTETGNGGAATEVVEFEGSTRAATPDRVVDGPKKDNGDVKATEL